MDSFSCCTKLWMFFAIPELFRIKKPNLKMFSLGLNC